MRLSAVVKQLQAAGVTGDALVMALEQIEEDSRRGRSAGAERTARWRERKASHVTSQRHGDALSLSSSSLEDSKEKKEESKKERARGEKISADWQPNVGHFAAGAKLGLTEQQVREQAEDMRLWAQANAHRAVARKSNWDLTFLGWLRRNKPKNGQGNGHAAHKRTVHDAGRDLLAKIRALDEPAPGDLCDGAGQSPVRRLSPR